MQDRIFLLVNIACPFSQVNSNLQRLVENTVQQKATFVLDHSFTITFSAVNGNLVYLVGSWFCHKKLKIKNQLQTSHNYF